MKKKLFKSLNLVLFLILFFAQPLSISAAVFQKQTTQNPTTVFEKKRELKQSLFQRFIQKRIEKRVGKRIKKTLKTKLNPEKQYHNEVIGVVSLVFAGIGLILLFFGVPLLTLLGVLFGVVGLILSTISFYTEDPHRCAQFSLPISIILTIFFFIGIASRKI